MNAPRKTPRTGVLRYVGLLLDTAPHDAPAKDASYVLASDYDALARTVAELKEALLDAREDIEHWSGYASEYFQDKHDLKGCLAKYDAIIARLDGSKP